MLPDVRGLYRFYSELAERFAAAGHHSIAIDYFGRTAGLAPRGEDFDYMTHLEEVRINQIQDDLAAAAAALRERTGVTSVAVVGFCFGGTNTYLASTNHDLDLSAFIAFYGALDSERMKALGVPMPLDHTATMRGPILGLFGGADAGIPVEQVSCWTSASTRRASSTTSTSIRARRTRSSTAASKSTPRRATTRGAGCSGSWPRACPPERRADPAVLRLAQRRHRAGDMQVLGRDRPRVEMLLTPGVLDLRIRRLAEMAGPAAPGHLAEIDERRRRARNA